MTENKMPPEADIAYEGEFIAPVAVYPVPDTDEEPFQPKIDEGDPANPQEPEAERTPPA